MPKTRIEFEGLTNAEIRALLYTEQADELMFSAQAYEKEGDQVKADAQWSLWTDKRAEIRAAYPDE